MIDVSRERNHDLMYLVGPNVFLCMCAQWPANPSAIRARRYTEMLACLLRLGSALLIQELACGIVAW